MLIKIEDILKETENLRVFQNQYKEVQEEEERLRKEITKILHEGLTLYALDKKLRELINNKDGDGKEE